jgi:hypothetical protein
MHGIEICKTTTATQLTSRLRLSSKAGRYSAKHLHMIDQGKLISYKDIFTSFREMV